MAGAAVGSVQCTNIVIIEDSVIEDSQVFEVSLSSNDPVVFGVSSAPVTILDNDGWSVNPHPFTVTLVCEGCGVRD